MMTKKGRLVYSTDPAAANDMAAKDSAGGGPAAGSGPEPPARSRQQVRVRRERAGRGGKTVTVAAPLAVPREEAQLLLARLKKICGAGGTLKDGATAEGSPAFDLEIQGDHADRIVRELTAAGFAAKRAGG
jgi:translation initiation factor 1